MQRPFTVDSLDHMVLHVRDIEKSVAFYRMFGGDEIDVVAGGGNTRVPLGPTQRLLLCHDPNYVAPPQGNLNHFSLVLDGSRPIDEVLDYVRAHGAEPYDGPKDNGRGYVQFRVNDPDGNEIELRINK